MPKSERPALNMGYGDLSWWRYRDLLPLLPGERPVTLGDPSSPLIDLGIDGAITIGKLDFMSVTGSFKDRNASMIATRLAHWGVHDCAVDSSGNAGIACAAYFGRAGIKCSIYVPSYTSEGKVKLMRAYGARVHIVEGGREQATEAALRRSDETFYGGHTHSPFFEIGGFLWACEVRDALGRCPDAVVVPIGSGSLLLGLARGFRMLSMTASSTGMPRIYAVQAASCAPLVDAFDRSLPCVDSQREWEPTIAEGIATSRPLRSDLLLDAVMTSGGSFLSVTDDEIEGARIVLSARGLCVEPTGAVGVAGLSRLLAEGQLSQGELVVASLTGSGQKYVTALR